jgi:uncharacterized protein YggU (UPF0235/DUF167 family)
MYMDIHVHVHVHPCTGIQSGYAGGMSARLLLRVAPEARPGVVGRLGDAWKVRAAAAPVAGKANAAVVARRAATLGPDHRDVRIVSGRGAWDNTVVLDGIGPDEIERRLAAASGAGKDPQ